jgi:hypothetical protein
VKGISPFGKRDGCISPHNYEIIRFPEILYGKLFRIYYKLKYSSENVSGLPRNNPVVCDLMFLVILFPTMHTLVLEM